MRDDDQGSTQLIPDECRPLYESLLRDGSMPIDAKTFATDPVIRELVDRGLAQTVLGKPPQLVAVGPDAVFERVLTRWLDNTATIRRDAAEAYRQAAAVQRHALRFAKAAKGPLCTLVVDKAQVVALHASLARAAERQICVWATGPYGETVGPERVAAELEADTPFTLYLPPDVRLLDRGGSVRSIYDVEFLELLPGAVERACADGEDVRLRQQKLPMKLIIVDDHSALVPLGPYGDPALFVRSRQMVALFQHFFDRVWDAAQPFPADRADAARARPTDRILNLMATGLKDEAIARQCNISVRTVRRHISAVMAELGTKNRFAAGVAAVRRGWVDQPA